MAKILIAAKGGFGDVLPLLAVLLALRDRGHEMLLAGDRQHAVLARDAGVRFQALDGVSEPFAPPSEEGLTVLRDLVDRADLLLANPLVPAAVLLARKLEKPWVYASASPLAFATRADPPWWPVLARLQRTLPDSSAMQQVAFRLARSRAAWQFRSLAGLARRLAVEMPGHPCFEGLHSPWLNLLLASPHLVEADALPAQVLLTGFCPQLPPSLENVAALQRLQEFLAAAAPPVVVAPGGADRRDPRGFVAVTQRACQIAGRRAVFALRPSHHGLVGGKRDFLALPYLPYSQLFAGAASVVHSGGIGALSWAVGLGVPSVLLPSVWDQFDNTRRALQRGFGQWPQRRPEAIAHALAQSMDRSWPALSRVAPELAAEDGAAVAATAIEALLTRLAARHIDSRHIDLSVTGRGGSIAHKLAEYH